MSDRQQQTKHPLLTISLLSSGRPETLWRCLDSLRLITDHVPSELIIVDTGCTPEVLDRMHEYTDQILPFTWCDDFSAARNVGLQAAHGSWFLYLDDDEWFVEAQPIVDFFLKGEYRHYDSACYYQRNFHDLEGQSWADAWVERMIDLRLEPSFADIIHEHLAVKRPAHKGRKLLPAIVEHYGYVYASDEERQRHYQRNISMLQRALAKAPRNLHLVTQLVREYISGPDYDALLATCDRALTLIGNRADIQAQWDLGYVYHAQITAHSEQQNRTRFDETLATALADPRLTDYYAADLCLCAAMYYYPLGDYENCRQMCRRYLEIYARIGKDTDAQFEQGSAYLGGIFDADHRNAASTFAMISGLKEDSDAELAQYAHQLSREDPLHTTNARHLLPALTAWFSAHPVRPEHRPLLDYVTAYTAPLLSEARRYYTARAFEGDMEYLPEEIREAAMFERTIRDLAG